MRGKSEYPTTHADQHMPDGSDPLPKIPIFYDYSNVGDWLYVEGTEDDPNSTPVGTVPLMPGAVGVLNFNVPNYNGASIAMALGTSAVKNSWPSGDGAFWVEGMIELHAYGSGGFRNWTIDDLGWLMSLTNGAYLEATVDDNGHFEFNTSVGDMSWHLDSSGLDTSFGVGRTFTLKDHNGNPKIRWTEGTADLHIPTGGTIVADL